MIGTCRMSGEALSIPHFTSVACAQCLFYIYFALFPEYFNRYHMEICPSGLLICDYNDETLSSCSCSDYDKIYNIPQYAINSSQSISLHLLHIEPPLPPDFEYNTLACCKEAKNCCKNVLAKDPYISPILYTSHTCPATWDGWQCFNRSKPGIVKNYCPSYIFHNPFTDWNVRSRGPVTKECLANGTWLKVYDNETLKEVEWTDYSKCIHYKATVKTITSIIAFGITVITIIPAIAIISWHSALKHQVVFKIHKHLLYALLCSALLFLFNTSYFVVFSETQKLGFGDYWSPTCRLLFLLQLRFFRFASYTWMLGEGVYLYRLLMYTFAVDTESMKPYYVLCWGIPLLITSIYASLRYAIDDIECWANSSYHKWIEWTVVGPCLITLCTNFILVLIVIYVLLKKIRCNPHLEPAQYAKAVRAVFMLVPVFGVHLCITIYPIEGVVYETINIALDGLQGCIVAIIVCYTNRTVIECLKKCCDKFAEERKLKKQSIDQRVQYKRSVIENAYAQKVSYNQNEASEVTTTDVAGTENNRRLALNENHPLLPRIPDENEDSVDITIHRTPSVVRWNVDREVTMDTLY